MRKIHFLPMLLLVLMVSFLSCKKESVNSLSSSPANTGETIAVKITPNQSYIYNQPDASNLSVNRQASHFSVSEAIANTETGGFSYRYVPAADYTGVDEISLISSRIIINYSSSNESGCGSGSSDNKTSGTSFITLKITIAN